MSYLLDVNILVAWGWSDHVDHERTVDWIAETKRLGQEQLFTSPIPEIGFTRVSVQRSHGRIRVQEASEVLQGMLKTLGKSHRFLADDVSGTDWPNWCDSAGKTTDAHLAKLAEQHDLRLATLDAGIPNAFLLPNL